MGVWECFFYSATKFWKQYYRRHSKIFHSQKMKLLASLILPSFCQDTKPVFDIECGNNEKWDSCGNPCKEKNCKDRVHFEFRLWPKRERNHRLNYAPNFRMIQNIHQCVCRYAQKCVFVTPAFTGAWMDHVSLAASLMIWLISKTCVSYPNHSDWNRWIFYS